MTWRASTAALALVIAAAPAAARAEPMTSLVHAADERAVAEHGVDAGFGLDGAFGASIGAAAGIAPVGERASLTIFFDATWAVGAIDASDMRYRVGARVDAIRAGAFRLRAAVAPTLRTTSSPGFDAQAFGAELRLSPGVHLRRWSAELDVAVHQALVTRIAPTDEYRELVYGAARAGWYGATARTVRVGGGAAGRFGPFEIALRGGFARTGSLDVFPSAYASVEASWLFGSTSP